MVQEGISGHFTSVTLRPAVTVTQPEHADLVPRLHEQAAAACVIASSVNFPVGHEPATLVAGG